MDLNFTKMQGCGNDYVYIDCYGKSLDIPDRSSLARRISDRHFGVGSDGLIIINPSVEADFEMEMYNSDGSRAQMCGNGIRCVAKYVFDHGYTKEKDFTIISGGSVKYISVDTQDGIVGTVTVDMGAPMLRASEVPVIASDHQDVPVISSDITVGQDVYKITCVSMGNPHAVVFSRISGSKDFDLDSLQIETIGPLFEHHSRFPERINTEFVHIIDREHMELRVWERGAGETLACGTGCCAAAVAGVLNGYTERDVEVSVLGGKLRIRWDEQSGHVYMTGPAEYAFTGTYSI